MTERSAPLPGGRALGADDAALPLAQAQALVERLVAPVVGTETLALRSALARVLAHDLVSTVDVPAHDNAAMDGYALRAAELDPRTPTVLPCVGTALAGRAYDAAVPSPGCVRIMTGAMMPPGLDTVVPQELVSVQAQLVSVPPGAVQPGDHRRRSGEDLARGEVALAAGRVLRPADLGLLASLGRAEVVVRRRVRVAFFSTGSELRSIGQPLDAGCVYDSNRYTLWAMLQRLGMEPIDLGVVADDPAALRAAFVDAARQADAVITSGGVGAGEADHLKTVVAQLGEVLFWQVALRPGRPLVVGRLRDEAGSAVLFGLPGNPVAVMVSFYALVRPALLRMSGALEQPLPMMRAVCGQALRKRPGRTEFQRGLLSRDALGRWQVLTTGTQGSGILRSMSQANALIVLGHDQGDVAAGQTVDVLPFDGLI